jgi:hypothetical protein
LEFRDRKSRRLRRSDVPIGLRFWVWRQRGADVAYATRGLTARSSRWVAGEVEFAGIEGLGHEF